MKKFLVALGLAVLLSAALWVPSLADGEAPISATVTVKEISVIVSPNSVDYEVLAFEESKTVGTVAAPNFTATNDGSVDEDFLVRGANATVAGSPNAWAIQDTALDCGTPVLNKFRHAVQGVSTGPVLDTAIDLTQTNKTGLASDVAPNDTKQFNSTLEMPCTGSTGLGEDATTSITIVAIAS